MAKKNKLAKVKNIECLNCGYPFFGNEIYCPECGQKNNSKRISFGNFINEIFKGFTSWDAKFWKTLFPLLTKPGKVSKDYIEGKRARYTNPFRFYIITSVIFFLILGLSHNLKKFTNFEKAAQEVKKKKNNNQELSDKEIDSLKATVDKNLNSPFISKKTKELILASIEKGAKENKKQNKKGGITIMSGSRLDKFQKFNYKNPSLSIDQGLDSLSYEKTFLNRFLYDRSIAANKLSKNDETLNQFLKDSISKAAGALFVLLPLFTLFLSFLYVRRKFSYVENLIFVFHAQTVFFLILSIYYILSIFGVDINFTFFLLLFLLYLFLAMKRFYNQGFFKTFFKFLTVNMIYFFLAVFGFVSIVLISLGLYE